MIVRSRAIRDRIIIVIVSVLSVTVHGQARKVDFEQDAVGQQPKGFLFGHTRQEGKQGRWVIQEEKG
jgi:hypothetical protein